MQATQRKTPTVLGMLEFHELLFFSYKENAAIGGVKREFWNLLFGLVALGTVANFDY